MPQNSLRESFGSAGIEQLSSNIERIIASYRHPYDFFVEMIQNCCDAIIDKFGFESLDKGKVTVEVNTTEYEIKITDNGCGISSDDIYRVLVTGASLKREKGRGKYGFMGFGLTFVAFQTEYLEIASVHDEVESRISYKDLWKVAFLGEDIPDSEQEKSNTSHHSHKATESGTTITLRFPKELPQDNAHENLRLCFSYASNHKLMTAILRTRSCIGSLNPFFNKDFKNFNFEFIVDGEKIAIDTKYLTNEDIVLMRDPFDEKTISKAEFDKMLTLGDSIPQKVRKETFARSEIHDFVTSLEVGERKKIEFRVYISAMSKTEFNDYTSEVNEGVKEEDKFIISNGLWLAFNGMPTGIKLDDFDHSRMLPYTVIVDVLSVETRKEMDAGRKGITEYTANLLRNKVGSILRDRGFIKYREYVVGAEIPDPDPLGDPVNDLLTLMERKQKKHITLVNSMSPVINENEVISLFSELCSKDVLKGYEIKLISSNKVYDGVIDYDLVHTDETVWSSTNSLGIAQEIFDRAADRIQKQNVVIEFKRDLPALYKDYLRWRKKLSDIKILIVWDVVDEKIEQYKLNYQHGIRKAQKSSKIFHGVTHELIHSDGVLPIISLKAVLEAEGM